MFLFYYLISLLILIPPIFSYDKIEVNSYLENPLFKEAKAIYPTDDGVYVLYDSKISLYTSTLSYISSYNLATKSYVLFAVDKNIYLVDENSCSVDVYSKRMDFLFSFSSCGEKNGQLLKPSDIKVYAGKVFVSDLSGYINVYNLDGIFLYSFQTVSKDGSYKYSPSKISFSPDGYIYLMDSKKRILVKYDIYGRYQSEFIYSKKGLCFDISSFGFLYLGSSDGKITEYDLGFSQTGVFGTKGKNRYEFQRFTDIKLYFDKIFILDSENRKILSLRIENKNIKKYKPYSFDEKIMISAGSVVSIKGKIFNLYDNKIIFYSDKKGDEGIYTFINGSTKKIIPCGGEGGVCLANDIAYNKNIYVIDGADLKVKVFDNEKRFLLSFGDKLGFMSSKKEGRFSMPVKLSIDRSGKIYIVDRKLSKIDVFNPDGIFLYSVDLSSYKDDTFLDIFNDEDNKIYLLSFKKIYVFSSDGKLEKKYELSELNSALSFCYDNIKYIFVLDKSGSVKVYDKYGKYVGSFIGSGKGSREVYIPHQIRYADGYLYISDSLERVVSFKIEHLVKANFYASYDSTSCVKFSYFFDDKEYLKDYGIERSTDGLRFYPMDLKDNDCEISHSSTYYYRLCLVSISSNTSCSDIISVYIPFTAQKISEETKQINKLLLEIIPINLDYIFSANYKYYTSNPIGRVMIKNNTSSDFENVKLSFFIKEYMDFPYDTTITTLPAGSHIEIPINATLNSKIVAVSENTPVQARLSLEYYVDSEKKKQDLSIPIKILSKNSMVWDDPRRIANFITVNDPVISDIAKILLAKKGAMKVGVDENIKIFSLIYNYISSLGIRYVEDPLTPFSILRSTQGVIDTVQYPRALLESKAGDCDDLTVLFASLLEAVGIATAIIDYGDHITLMFEIKEKDEESGISPDLIVEYEGRNYIPFEVTRLSEDFYDSIRYASTQYRSKKGAFKIYPVKEILSIYEPPTFAQTEGVIKVKLPN